MARLALAQLGCSVDLEGNVLKSLAAIETASDSGADLIAFPEVQFSPFFPQYESFDASPYLMSLNDPIIGRFQDKCRERGILAALNVYLKENGRKYDASVLIGRDGRIIGTSKMVHITQAPMFYEQNYYDPSPDGFRVFDTDIGKVGIVVCFDRHYPESFRNCALQGADIVLVPTVNMIGEPLEMFEWEMRVAAFHNSIYIAMCNRVGREGDAVYCGRSMLAGPTGAIVMRCGEEEAIECGNFDPAEAARVKDGNNFLRLFDETVFRSARDALR